MAEVSREDDSRQMLRSAGGSELTAEGHDANTLNGVDGSKLYIDFDDLHIESWVLRSSCGISLGKQVPQKRAVQFHDVLSSTVTSSEFILTYTETVNKSKIRPVTETIQLSENDIKHAQTLCDRILSLAYGRAQRKRRIKVVVNPFGGRGNALRYWASDIEPIFKAAHCDYHVVHTTHAKHAEEMGETLDSDSVDVVACCSGDGIPYEIWNGLGRRKDARTALAKVAVIQLPCGSGNAMSLNCNGTISPSKAALAVLKGVKTRMDLCSVTQGDRRTLSFCSQALGITADSDLGTEHLRWLGSARFTIGFVIRLLGKTLYPVDVAVSVEEADKVVIEAEYKEAQSQPPVEYTDAPARYGDADDGDGLPPLQFGTISSPLPDGWEMKPFPNLGNFYCGNMPFMAEDLNFFPFSRIGSGQLDLISIRGDVSTFAALRMLSAAGEGNLWASEVVNYHKIKGYRIIPRQKEGYISIDGERYPFEPFQVEVHKGLGCTLTPEGREVLPK